MTSTMSPVPPDLPDLKARLIAEDILIAGLSEWLRKNGLVSYEKVATRSPGSAPEFSSFRWDLTAPSYALPFKETTGGVAKPGFVVADATLSGEELEEKHIRYFVHKVRMAASQRNARPFLPILVGPWFSQEGLRSARSSGIVATTPGNLLGQDIANALKALIATLANTAAIAAEAPQTIADLFSKLGRIEGAAGNLRGALFEMIVGYCVQEREGGSVEIGVGIVDPKTGAPAEIDVLRTKGRQEAWVYECKGHGPSQEVQDEEVEKWLAVRVPRAFNWLRAQDRLRSCQLAFELWTSGRFSPKARQRLEAAKARTRPTRYLLDWKDGSGVLRYAKALNSRHMSDILREHYMGHPLSR